MKSPLIDTWHHPVPQQSICFPPRILTNEELLWQLEDVISCQTYCPTQCNHDRSISFDDLCKEILLRMNNGEKYEQLSL
jgi:hypothetical protein